MNYLPDCLKALQAQSYPSIDLVVVDNASRDESAEWIARHYPAIRLERLGTNTGFCHAFNLGVKISSGEFVLSLNPDVTARPDFVENLLCEALRDERIGIVAPKLLRADNPEKIDSTGLLIDRQRRPYDRGQMEPDRGQYDGSREIFGACGAAALYRRSMLEDVACQGEFLDEDFFAYYEDVDLAWRANLQGWKAAYAPGAVALHMRGWGDTLRKNRQKTNHLGPRLALRNRYLMILKNDSFGDFLLDLPWIFLPDIPRLVYIALFKTEALGAVMDFIRLYASARVKRKLIHERVVSRTKPFRALFVNPKHKYLNQP